MALGGMLVVAVGTVWSIVNEDGALRDLFLIPFAQQDNKLQQVFRLDGDDDDDDDEMIMDKLIDNIVDDGLTQPLQFEPRVWRSWPTGQNLCFPPSRRKVYVLEEVARHNRTYPIMVSNRLKKKDVNGDLTRGWFDRGLQLRKPTKVGGSTASGVNLRIAKNMAARLGKTEDLSGGICDGTYIHTHSTWLRNRHVDESFLWSIIRDPTRRAVSLFYHFKVSKFHEPATVENFKKYTDREWRNYFINAHRFDLQSISPLKSLNEMFMTKQINQILRDYDFFAMTERFDESMVMLHMLLGVPMGDVLYLNAKTNGGYDGGGGPEGCVFIQPSIVTAEMQDLFDSEEWQQEVVYWDNLLFQQVNKSFEMTIDTLGRDKFQNKVQQFRHAQQVVKDRCAEGAKYPCLPDGSRRKAYATNCLMVDSACNYECLDEVAADLKIDTI